MNNKNYPDFLVPIDIALALKKIGFRNESSFFKFDRFSGLIFFNEKIDKTLNNSYQIISIEEFFKEMTIEEINNYHFHSDFELLTDVPTWEQVFEWFRKRGYEIMIDFYCVIELIVKTGYKYRIFSMKDLKLIENDFFIEKYEEAREALVEELIKIYETQLK